MRTEEEVFQDLAQLCVTDGYAHVVAYFCYRDNLIRYKDKLKAKDFEHQSSMESLARTEISTLIGLMCKADVSLEIPRPDKMQELIEKTDAILKELHEALTIPWRQWFENVEEMKESGESLFGSGMALREPIFYSGDSAYDFQYREFAFRKYSNDAQWIEREKGFTLVDAKKMVDIVGELHIERMMAALAAMQYISPEQWTILPALKITSEDLAAEAGLSVDVVENFLQAFSIKPSHSCNNQFDRLDSFNQTNATPFVNLDDKNFVLFQPYSLYEAFYETPFFWMLSDNDYRNEATKNRGSFLEQYSAERLRSVFGQHRVFENVNIWGAGNKNIGEIDVLVLFANRAIIVQAKSKRLTIEARKGNDLQIKDDFKKSVQDSYDQGLLCAKCLNDTQYVFKDATGRQLQIKSSIKEIYIFCIVSDHYPALGFQARQFLKCEETEVIKSPFVMDIFLLDVLCEMLPSPLYFLSYVNRRVGYADKILSTHELVILSFHLKQNLWFDEEFDLISLDGSISVDLDIAMAARRTGVPGADTPKGILTKLGTSPVKRLIEQIEHLEEPATIDFGFLLLTLGGESLDDLGNGMGQMFRKAKAQRNHHDLSMAIGETGITMHFNAYIDSVAAKKLREHCERRKYICKASSWFGLCINPENLQLRFGIELMYPWEQSDDMDEATKQASTGYKTLTDACAAQANPKPKVGRNDPCICGSGKKFKKCCLGK